MSVKDLIVERAQSAGLDPKLALAVAKQESNYNQSAVSPVGAIGVFQLMPKTAQGLGVDPYDLQQNIDGGIAYLNQMLARYGGDTTKALAAYNAGPGNVDKYGGVPPFAETQNYVQRILASIGTIDYSPPIPGPPADPSHGPIRPPLKRS